MKNLLAQIEAIDFYFSKIEVYLSRKHRNQLLKTGDASGTDSNTSGSPKSTTSDRHATLEDDHLKRIDFETSMSGLDGEGTTETFDRRESETKAKFIFPSEEDYQNEGERRINR